MRLCVTAFCLGLIPYIVFAKSPLEHRIDTPFKYELYLADIHCWISGPCEGRVEINSYRGLAKKLEAVISSTKKSIDIATYGVRNQPWFINILRHFTRTNISVRMTVDQLSGAVGQWSMSQNFAYGDASELADVLGDDRLKIDVNQDGSVRTGSIMHHKFMVFDERRTWVGSTNISNTEIGSEYSANTSILIESPEIARLFMREFDQMYLQRKYSIYKSASDVSSKFLFSDRTRVEVYFSPQDRPIDHAVVPFIDGARTSLDVGIFYLTSLPVIDALISAKRRGVRIRIINDATAANNQYSGNEELRAAGIDVRVENWGGKMHMKTAIRDGRDSLIGSANWTKAANNDNDENIVVISNNPRLATELRTYFESLWNTLESSFGPNYRTPKPESPDSINSCQDGIDNDHNGGIDAASGSC
jgi:phosphatidylserine/phosphatidylglycerophosphate/cardiolipin synthase-like enzyme